LLAVVVEEKALQLSVAVAEQVVIELELLQFLLVQQP
jgi:hypothetical protein